MLHSAPTPLQQQWARSGESRDPVGGTSVPHRDPERALNVASTPPCHSLEQNCQLKDPVRDYHEQSWRNRKSEQTNNDKIEAVINNLSTEKSQEPDDFTGGIYQYLKKI